MLVFLVIERVVCPRLPRYCETAAANDSFMGWNRYTGYPSGQPLITILKIVIPRNTALTWHHHPIISAAYVVSGQIILEKKETRERKAFHAGQALAETVNTIHRGYTTDQPTELIVFYAGAPGVPLSIKTK
jgi:quercetin dioxygenase-like cupin family protein